jgi:hypothetical protein
MAVQHVRLTYRFVAFLVTFACTTAVRAETKHQHDLRTDDAETPEPMTTQPLKAAMQNLFLQEDSFPQQHFAVQTGLRMAALTLNRDPSLSLSAGAELGLVDSWTVSVRAPVSFVPTDERGLGNAEVGLLYSAWVSRDDNFRLTANLRNVLPSPSAAGDNAWAHDLSMIGYARWAPLHVQAVLTLDVSYGRDVSPSPRLRPEGAVAAIVKIDDFAGVLEAAIQREFDEVSYLGALGFFWYPGSFEIGVAAVLDASEKPLAIGANTIISYAFDPPD